MITPNNIPHKTIYKDIMARYELGAIYKIDDQNGEIYYLRLLTNDCYGVFAPLKGELNEETFAQTPYRLYFSCSSFPTILR